MTFKKRQQSGDGVTPKINDNDFSTHLLDLNIKKERPNCPRESNDGGRPRSFTRNFEALFDFTKVGLSNPLISKNEPLSVSDNFVIFG